MSQLTLNFEPSIPERWPTLREYVPTLFDLEAVDAEQEAAA